MNEMNKLNPELDSQVDALAELCCDILERNRTDSVEAAQPLIQALVRGGYARISDINLQVRVERRAVQKCRSKAIHRREELTGLAGQMQKKFDELVVWETQTPRVEPGNKAANISSATDS